MIVVTGRVRLRNRGREMDIDMEAELTSLVKVAFTATMALAYCYYLVSSVRPGKLRLLCHLPVFYLFTQLPLLFSSVHLRGISSFFLSWLAIFKLLLFSFSKGPLSNPDLTFPLFLALASLPIKLQDHQQRRRDQQSKIVQIHPLLNYSVKALLLALLTSRYSQRHRYQRLFLISLYAVHMYLALDLIFAFTTVLSKPFLVGKKIELEPQFDAPYLSSSLQNFWSRRWNLMVTRLLHPTVYVPVRIRFGPYAGAVAVFVVSGAMHEAMFYYLTLRAPTGEVTCFFVLQGVCTAVEVAAKIVLGGRGWKPVPPVVAAPLTVGFVFATGLWLFFPQLLRSDVEEQVIGECTAMLDAAGKVFHLVLDPLGVGGANSTV